ncbi:hypothetical protein FUAX_09180 [Fulvitalea axinellae]|uniref:Gfo/Idh/MocA family oxidoreductase n=1 Tax=Fulvitalea axinellae TaxID=1182444 RepID=A0AAU9D6M0_9BACT|nr:hypothetical protein FUAX_09180 [Fulvitalea axinellae]
MDKDQDSKKKIKRRNILKGMVAAPVIGLAAWELDYFFRRRKNKKKGGIAFQFSEDNKTHVDRSETINVGIIGAGTRGSQLMAALGFVSPKHIDGLKKRKEKNPDDKAYQNFLDQPDLGIRITAVCDIFDVRAKAAIEAGANLYREGTGGKMADKPRRHRTYTNLLDDPKVDAVVIATPDHWHGTMAIEATKRGKHVYVEKPVTWRLDETYEVRKTVKESGIVFQLGHQNRQIDSYRRCKELVGKGALGKVNLVETTTNRNSPNGAWVYKIHPKANESTIDWKQFIGPAPAHAFSKERFFRWRCWWDYSTGLIGDLFTHEYDVVNQVLGVGIPTSATASGGIYHFKDGRTVPDVLQIALEFGDDDLTMLYSASQANSHNRGKVFMGTDATVNLGRSLEFFVDRNSKIYKEKLKKGTVKSNEPAYIFDPSKGIDGTTSATERYFAERGLLNTTRKGRSFSTSFLHLEEWLDAVRTKTQPSCNIDRAFEEGIATHMATIAYKEKRTVYWDKKNEKVVTENGDEIS